MTQFRIVTLPFDAVCFFCAEKIAAGGAAAHIEGRGMAHLTCATPSMSPPTYKDIPSIPVETNCMGCSMTVSAGSTGRFVFSLGMYHPKCAPVEAVPGTYDPNYRPAAFLVRTN